MRGHPSGPSWRIVRLVALGASLALVGARCDRVPSTRDETQQIPRGGIYRSDDGGVTFRQVVLLSDGSNLALARPSQVVAVVAQPDYLYLVADEALFVTATASESWTRIATPLARVFSVSVHPRNPDILLVTGSTGDASPESKIIKSTDGGATWADVFIVPPAEEEVGTLVRRRRSVTPVVTSITHDPLAPEVVLAGTSSGALLASTDGGTTWQTRRAFHQGITGLKHSPRTKDLLFVRLADGGLARSTDGGRTADAVRLSRTPGEPSLFQLPTQNQDGVEAANAVEFAGASSSGDVILVGTIAALYRSDDGGSAWTKLTFPTSGRVNVPISSVAASPDGMLWATAGAILFGSRDDGTTWRTFDTPITTPLRFVLADPTDPKRVYLFFTR